MGGRGGPGSPSPPPPLIAIEGKYERGGRVDPPPTTLGVWAFPYKPGEPLARGKAPGGEGGGKGGRGHVRRRLGGGGMAGAPLGTAAGGALFGLGFGVTAAAAWHREGGWMRHTQGPGPCDGRGSGNRSPATNRYKPIIKKPTVLTWFVIHPWPWEQTRGSRYRGGGLSMW